MVRIRRSEKFDAESPIASSLGADDVVADVRVVDAERIDTEQRFRSDTMQATRCVYMLSWESSCGNEGHERTLMLIGVACQLAD